MQVEVFKGRIFYPVMYEGEGRAALDAVRVVNSKGREVPVFRAGGVHCEEMRKGLGDILSGQQNAENIAAVYTVERRETLRLPKAGQSMMLCTRNNARTPLCVTDTRIVLFETRVAFIEMDVELKGMSLDEVMNATYYLCEPKDEANHFEYDRQVFDPATREKHAEHVAFSLKEWFLQCASYLPECRNFEDRPLASTTGKPLLYGYYLLAQRDESFEAVAGNIALNYKASYKGERDEGRHVLRAFDNSYWCASYNAAVNVTHKVEDVVTNRFFETTFAHKWETEYLFLFLNTIHQKYAVLKYLAELSGLSCARYDYALMKKLLVQGERIQQLCELLKIRCFFELPSNVEHVNRIYDFLRWNMDVPFYLENLNTGIENSVNVCKGYVSKVKEIEELEKTARTIRNEVYIALFTASITCLTFFHSSYETLLALFSGRFGDVGFDGVIVTATFLATIGTVIFNVAKQRENITETKEKIEKLKKRTISL